MDKCKKHDTNDIDIKIPEKQKYLFDKRRKNKYVYNENVYIRIVSSIIEQMNNIMNEEDNVLMEKIMMVMVKVIVMTPIVDSMVMSS